MKRLFAILLFCVLVPCAYGETINYDNGDKYDGEVRNGKRHGHGTYTFGSGAKSGDIYYGEWKDGKYHGQGIFSFRGGQKYFGEFKDGQPNGQGTFTFPDGSKYVGEYKNGEQWNGVRYLASGKIWGTVSGGKPCEGCKPTAKQHSGGHSLDHPIIINAASSLAGMLQEYAELDNRFGNYKFIRQSLLFNKGRAIDLFQIESDGKLIEIYFDVSSWWRKP